MGEAEETTMRFWDHMEELLTRLRIILISVFASAFLIGFWPSDSKAFLNLLNFTCQNKN